MEQRVWDIDESADTRSRLSRWGHFGKPVLYFPTCTSGIQEVQERGLLDALRPFIESGRIKLYTIDSPNSAIWLGGGRAQSRSERQAAYDHWLVSDVFPLIVEDCEGSEQPWAVMGASHGAYNAVTAATKHPEQFNICVAASGRYEFDRLMGDQSEDTYYYNMPLYFVPHLDGEHLNALRQSIFVLSCGRGRWEEPDQTERMVRVLRQKNVPVQKEIWGLESDHDWPTWRRMLPLFLGRLC